MRITNASVNPGDVVSATLLNEKFTDIQTATTGNLDEDNFGAESLDVNQFDTTTLSGKNGTILVDWQSVANGLTDTGGTVYTSTINTTAPVAITHGSTNPRLVWPITGVVLEANSVLRVMWAVTCEEVGTYTDANYPFISADRVVDPVWLCWLQWDITSAALANWTEVPYQGDLRDSFVDAEGSTVDELQATMVIPHGWRYYDGVQRHSPTFDAEQQEKMTFRRSYFYNPTSSNTTIYGIRLVFNGLYHAERSAETGDKNALEKDNASPGWSGETIKLAGVWLSAVIHRSI